MKVVPFFHFIKECLFFVLLQVPSLMMDSQFSEFTPDITPIMLAAHTNNYEIIKLLVQRKVTLYTQVSVSNWNLINLDVS